MSHTLLYDGGPVGGLTETYSNDDEIPLPKFRDMMYYQGPVLWIARYRYGATASSRDGKYRSNYLYDGYERPVTRAYSQVRGA